MLKNGADVNSVDKDGFTSLHFTARKGDYGISDRIQIAKLLIEYGAYVNLLNKYGETPLQLAIQNGEYFYCEIPIQHDGKPHLKSCLGHKAIAELLSSIEEYTLSTEESETLSGDFSTVTAYYHISSNLINSMNFE